MAAKNPSWIPKPGTLKSSPGESAESYNQREAAQYNACHRSRKAYVMWRSKDDLKLKARVKAAKARKARIPKASKRKVSQAHVLKKLSAEPFIPIAGKFYRSAPDGIGWIESNTPPNPRYALSD